MRSKSNIVILVIAIVMGAFAAFLARSFIQGQSIVTTSAVRTIVVASMPLEVGQVLGPEHITELTWNASTLPDGAFTSKDEFLKIGRAHV